MNTSAKIVLAEVDVVNYTTSFLDDKTAGKNTKKKNPTPHLWKNEENNSSNALNHQMKWF